MGEIWSAKRIRDTYFNFFTDKGHTVVDPLLFSYGMNQNQYKPRFLGVADPQSEFMNLKRACHSQKWIRAGESHSDLDKVATLDYHHTSFEMLGNCSIGDYFKEEAIAWAWELLTKVYGLEADHIYATYFGGDEKAGLEPDNEARDIWLRFLPSRRVLPFGYKDNFWEMGGDTGLCGPCTKIHYYNRDAPTCMDIWNILFIQFNKELDGLKPLPTKHVDTRFEYERVTSILQNKVTTSYDKGNLMEHVIVLNDSEKPHHLRSKALIELTNMDLSDQNFAKLLWFSKTTNLLVKEIGYAKTSKCHSDLITPERTDHVLRLLKLLQVVVEVPEARASLLNGLVYFYLRPFVTATGTEETTELLRRQSLKVLNSLLKVGHPHNENLIYSGLVHWCLQTLPVGSESTRELAMEIIEKVIDIDVGLIYVISDRDRLWEVVHGMSLAVSGFRFPPLLSTLEIAIRCFHRLAQNDSIAYELKRFIPRSFRDGTFEDIVDAEEYIAMLVELATRFG